MYAYVEASRCSRYNSKLFFLVSLNFTQKLYQEVSLELFQQHTKFRPDQLKMKPTGFAFG